MMSNKIALESKEKGNAAFKAGDFPGAIGHYTAAILADPNDSTFPLNRAAAYLKLGKNNDAERDCTTVLSIDAKNVKALFRRGQARMTMSKLGDANADFEKVLKLDPGNAAVKPELERVKVLLSKPKPAPRTTPIEVPVAPLPGPSHSGAPKRRRIPITIVDDDSAPTVTTSSSAVADLMTPVSSRPLNGSSSTVPAPATMKNSSAGPTATAVPLPAKPATFQEAKKAREITRSVGGGIFRTSGQHKIVGTDGTISATSAPHAVASTPSTTGSWMPKHEMSQDMKAPMTFVMFMRSWDSLRDSDKRWKLLTQIPPGAIPGLFQTSLEAETLASVVKTLAAALDAAASESDLRLWVHAYAAAVAQVPRFQTLTLFMSTDEKAVARSMLGALDDAGMAVEGWEALYNR